MDYWPAFSSSALHSVVRQYRSHDTPLPGDIRTSVGQYTFVFEGNGPLVPVRLLTARETDPTSDGVDVDADIKALQSS